MELEEVQKRISNLDLANKELREKLQALADQFNHLSKQSITKAEFHDKRLSFDSSVSQNNENIQKNFLDIQEKLTNIKNEMASYKVYFDTHQRKLASQDIKSQELKHELDSQRQHQLAHQIKLNSIDQLNFKSDNLSNDHHSFKNEISRALDELRLILNKSDSRLKPLENLIQDHESKISSNKVSQDDVNSLRKSINILSDSHQSLEASSKKSLEDMVIQLQSKIDKIPIIELPKPVDFNGIVQASHKNLSDKLHAISMDLENSQLRSNNNDLQIKQFEKKLENIYLLLKKHEITK